MIVVRQNNRSFPHEVVMITYWGKMHVPKKSFTSEVSNIKFVIENDFIKLEQNMQKIQWAATVYRYIF